MKVAVLAEVPNDQLLLLLMLPPLHKLWMIPQLLPLWHKSMIWKRKCASVVKRLPRGKLRGAWSKKLKMRLGPFWFAVNLGEVVLLLTMKETLQLTAQRTQNPSTHPAVVMLTTKMGGEVTMKMHVCELKPNEEGKPLLVRWTWWE
jgi:hypothetical protein